MYLPLYSPDYSPIEPCWSTLKTCLRAIDTVTASDARGWFSHCGYAVQ